MFKRIPHQLAIHRVSRLLLGAILCLALGASIHVALGGQPPAVALAAIAAAEAAVAFLHQVIGPDAASPDERPRR